MHNLFEDNCIVLIDNQGKVCGLPRKEGESNHCESYLRLKQLVPGILDGFQGKLWNGFDPANYIAANGTVVLWSTDVQIAELIAVTIPKTISYKTNETLTKILPILQNYMVCVNTAHFKDTTSRQIEGDILYDEDCDPIEAIAIIEDYITQSQTPTTFVAPKQAVYANTCLTRN